MEVEPTDIEIANRLAGEVLGRSLDELPPQTRRVLTLLDTWISTECEEMNCDRPDYRFTTREVRDALSLGQTQAKTHLARLTELEYLVVHRAVPGRPHVYELLYQGEGSGGDSFLPGLLDPSELGIRDYDDKRSGQTGDRSGSNAERSGVGRPKVGPQSGQGRTPPIARNRLRDHDKPSGAGAPPMTALLEDVDPSYVVAGPTNGSRP